jgi:hypothetical protein
MAKVKCLEGGTVAAGATFEWENHANSPCDLSGCSGFLTQDAYTVLAKQGSTPGSTSATVKTGISGEFTYTASNSVKRQTPKMTVSSK